MKDILVSVITPCFNSEITISKTLDSMLYQSYQNFEYIIIDGSSHDRTMAIIDEYKDKFNGKLKVVSEKDNGIYDAMNKGIRLSQGEIVGIVNSDDYLEPTALESIVMAMTDDKYQIVYGAVRFLKNGMEKSVSINNHKFLTEQMIWHPGCFVSKAIYADIAIYDVKYKSCADYDFLLKIYQDDRIKFYPVYSVISNFQLGGFSDGYIAEVEKANVRYSHGIIDWKRYFLERSICIAKKALGVLQ